ncbi:hypothetical protein JXM83_02040 [Candidatus Woesearchaeota archaeon]|nr:hypothetical protein [Candidatus Woesearchaeota archaeon]
MTVYKGLLPIVEKQDVACLFDCGEDIYDGLDRLHTLSIDAAEAVDEFCSRFGHYTKALEASVVVYDLLSYKGVLPIVVDSTVRALDTDVDCFNTLGDFADSILYRLKEDNVGIYELLANKGLEEKIAGTYTYRLFELQKEGDLCVVPRIPFERYSQTGYFRHQLNIALTTENYEEACVLRDVINSYADEKLQPWELISSDDLTRRMQASGLKPFSFSPIHYPTTWVLKKKLAFEVLGENYETAAETRYTIHKLMASNNTRDF